MKILILRVSAIGDVIHTLPSLFYLKKSLPHAHISWIVQEKAASFLHHQPFVDTVYELPNHFLHPKNWAKTRKIVCALRKEQWDVIIDFQGLSKTSFLIMWLQGKKFGFDTAHARERVSTYLTHHHTTPVYKNIIQKNLALSSSVVTYLSDTRSCPAVHEVQKAFALFVPEEKKVVVDTWLQEHGLESHGLESHRLSHFVTLAPNTTWPSKHWPLAHWKKLLRLLSKAGIPVILLGQRFGAHAAHLATYIQDHKLPIPLAPKWDLLTTSYLLQKSDLVIAPDTGILHLADFLDVQTIGIFGPTLAKKHGPFLKKENIKNVIQVPCEHRYKKEHGTTTRCGATDCMAALTPETLCEKIEKRIVNY